MRKQYDFSKGQRGKFFHEDAELHLPIYLDAEVQKKLAVFADAKGLDLSVFVNDLLKKDIEIIKIAS